MKKILLIVGSLRKNSFNRQLACIVKDLLKDKADVSFLEYADIPFMNQDIEFPAPKSIERVRKDIQEADSIWIFSPEYNYQIPGVLKNLLDWLSRSLIPNDKDRVSAVKGKTVTISSVAGKSAGVSVRKNLSGLLEVMAMNVVGGMGTGISLDAEAFRTNILTLSDKNKEEINSQIELLLAE